MASGVSRQLKQLAWPAGAQHRRIYWRYAVVVAFYHLVALLAFVPGFFSWTGLLVAAIGWCLVFMWFVVHSENASASHGSFGASYGRA